MARHLIASDATIRATKPTDKPYRLNDGDGLYLLIRPDGSPKGGWWWRFDYSFSGRRKTLSLGTYPNIWTPPFCKSRPFGWKRGLDCSNISGLSERPSALALMTFARGGLATFTVSDCHQSGYQAFPTPV